MNFRPLQDRVLLRRLDQDEKTPGGIIIPDTAKEKPMEGEVIAAGPGARGEDGTLHPLDLKVGDRVLLRRLDEESKTAGGIIIPDTAKEKPMEGEVIAAGPGARGEDGTLHPLDLKVGDRVLFGKWAGTEVKIDGEDLVIMKESDVLGVIEGVATKRKAA
jgi:chaperonin GroES